MPEPWLAADGASGPANDQFGLNGIARIELGPGAGDSTKKNLGGGSSHFAQGLADGGESGILVGGALNVVESDHGDVFGNGETRLTQSANGTHGGNIVEGKESRKGLGRGKQGFHGFVSELWRRGVSFELDHEMAIDGQSKVAGDIFNIRPANFGIGAEFLAFHEGDLTMPEVEEMFERDFRGTPVIEDDVGHTIHIVVAGDRDHRHRKVEVPGSIDGDEAIDRALEQHAGIFVDEIGAVAMAGDEIKVTFLEKVVFDTAHDGGGISVADFGNDDADREAALRAQRTCEKVGTVFKLSGGGEDAVFSLLRYGIGDVGAVDNQGDGGG